MIFRSDSRQISAVNHLEILRLTGYIAHLKVLLNGQTSAVADHVVDLFVVARRYPPIVIVIGRCTEFEAGAGFVVFADWMELEDWFNSFVAQRTVAIYTTPSLFAITQLSLRAGIPRVAIR